MEGPLTTAVESLATVPIPGVVKPPAGGVLAVVVILMSGTAILLWRKHHAETGGTATPAAARGDAARAEQVPLDAPSDPDRVINLLADHGGRMHQSDIVEHTGWSKSKVSVLLSEMADDGDIDKLRLGRENIISLPGNEPHVTSPSNEQ